MRGQWGTACGQQDAIWDLITAKIQPGQQFKLRKTKFYVQNRNGCENAQSGQSEAIELQLTTQLDSVATHLCQPGRCRCLHRLFLDRCDSWRNGPYADLLHTDHLRLYRRQNLQQVPPALPCYQQRKLTLSLPLVTAGFRMTLPAKYNLPVSTPTELVTKSDGSIGQIVTPTTLRLNTFQPLQDVNVVTNSNGDWQLDITRLQPTGASSVKYVFEVSARAPNIATQINPTDITCALVNGSTVIASVSAVLAAGQTTVPVGQKQGGQFTVSSTGSENGKTGETLRIEYTIKSVWIQNNFIEVHIPKSNLLYQAGVSNVPLSLVTSSTYTQAVITIDGTTYAVDTAQSFYQAGSQWAVDTIVWGLQSGGPTLTAADKPLVITVPISMMPVNSSLLAGFTLKIENSQGITITSITDTNFADVEVAVDTANPTTGSPVIGGLTTSSFPTSQTGTATITGNTDGVGTENAQYQFEFRPALPIPGEGVLSIVVPSGIVIPSASSLTVTCSTGCTANGSLTYTAASSTMEIRNAFQNGYLTGGTLVRFIITGFTNAGDTAARAFTLNTFFDNSGTLVAIERIQGFSISATEGVCNVQSVIITDGDNRIYAQPESYSFSLWCSHALKTTYGLKIKFPSDFILIDRASCVFTGYNIRYYCQTYASTNTIEIREFTSSEIQAKALINFTVNSIINPGSFDDTGTGEIFTIDATGAELDKGTWSMPQGAYGSGNITTFRVQPASFGVGEFPVKYQFTVTPNGEVDRYAYMLLDLPEELTIPENVQSRVNRFETSCGLNLIGFTNDVISCVVRNGGRQIQIKDGFLYQASSNLTDSDGLYFPPELGFELDGFQNPREGGVFGPFNVSIYTRKDKLLYQWQTADAPTFRVSGIAQPAYMQPSFGSRTNGALSYLEFLVTTTGGLSEGDKIIIKIPFGWQFTPASRVFGNSNNLANVLESTVSVDQRQIEITAAVSIALKRDLSDVDEDIVGESDGRRELQAKINSGLSYKLRITNILNRSSTRPSDQSIQYFVYSSAGVLFEEKTSGMEMENTKSGELNPTLNGMVPDDFRSDFETNYTLSIQVENYEKNMAFTLALPEEIDFGDEDPLCSGLTGSTGMLVCEANRKKKSLFFPNVFTFYDANPGKLEILIQPLRNPKTNLVTSSFLISTQTFDGYLMDTIRSGISINFYCEYPCAECPQGLPSKCESCYQTSVERFFHEFKCLADCPSGMVETEELTCTDCISPCVTCDGGPEFCLSCIDGYYVIEGGQCREEVVWYFPFLGMAFIFFMLITISEIVTKRASNFKESLIAFWSIPEVLSWGCLIWFMWHRVSAESYSTGLAVIGAIFYVCLNSVHAVMHPRYMVPNTLYSYKQLLTDYKCGTFIARAIAYLISFKFSLILVSYFFNSPRLKGDYSAMNWKQFNRLSLAFIFLPYSCMMASCILFIVLDGFWSYPGFVAAEVIVLSTFVAILLMIDAMSAIKCKTVGKKKTNKAIKVATGADYESDEDEINMRKKVQKQAQSTRVRDRDDFGESYDEEYDSVDDLKKMQPRSLRRQESEASYNSKMSQQTHLMNEEARKQIAMLEELAHQMREEKRQLQLDKDRIEHEKLELQEERTRTAANLDAYVDDYNRQTTALSNQVREMERQKLELVSHVESRLEDGNRANEILQRQIKEADHKKQILASQALRKNFRDFEGEMEDYEPVEEENSEDAQSSIADVVDSAQLPVRPAFGQIDYYRHMEGDDQHWMQQITPRAGGDSMLGQHDMEDDIMLQMEKNATAHFEVASIPPSRHEGLIEPGAVEAEFQELTSQLEAAQSEEFQQRSDAEMEINSDVDVKQGDNIEHFIPERAIFSQLQDRDEKDSQAEFFENVQAPVYESIEKPPTRHAVEQRHFLPIEAAMGEADKEGELVGPTEHFFKQEPPTYEQVLEEGDMERQATAQHFFNPEKAMQGDADDANRSGLATPMSYFQKTEHFFANDIEDPNMREKGEERLFNNEQAVQDAVSNIDRSRKGSEIMYQEREQAAQEDVGDKVSKDATEQNFIQREQAMFSRELDPKNKNATQSEFFKHEEAVRGDITSNDRSVAATQQNYFANVEHAELGRADSYNRLKSDVGQEFLNKSDLGGLSERKRAAGNATPVNDLQGSVDYLNKSEAEYGRQSTVQEGASQTKYFENEENPAFGAAEDYRRNKEVDQEYNEKPEEDSSGVTESSEGDIADHQPFAAGGQKRQKGADPEAALIKSPQKRTNKSPRQQQQQPVRPAKTILYSDKSETSVEDLMDDTPSNYNIQNGRFEGKSLGLKALLLHAKNYGQNQTVDADQQRAKPELLQGLAGLADHQNRSPQHARPGDGMLAPGFLGAQKGIIGSQNDERQFISNLYQTGQSMGQVSQNNQWRAAGPINGNQVPVIGEESSNNGDVMRNTRNNVRTNKQFVEDPRAARPPAGHYSGARSPDLQQQARGRGAAGPRKVTKNNYFGGST